MSQKCPLCLTLHLLPQCNTAPKLPFCNEPVEKMCRMPAYYLHCRVLASSVFVGLLSISKHYAEFLQPTQHKHCFFYQRIFINTRLLPTAHLSHILIDKMRTIRYKDLPSTTFADSPALPQNGNSGSTAIMSHSRVLRKSGAGFTILELLISVAIIAMLSAITMTLLSGVKEKNRDAKRMQDIHQLQNALSLYYANHSQFPIAATAINITGTDTFSEELEADGVIPAVQTDPLYPAQAYVYESSAGSTFTITFCLETDTIEGYSVGCNNTVTP